MNYSFKVSKYSPIIIAIALLLVTVILVSVLTVSQSNKKPSSGALFVASTIKADNFKPKYGEYYKSNDEMLAVWVPYMSLDVSNDFSEENFKNKFNEIINTSKAHNINTLIVHIRPFSDSLYPSKYFPYSHILTGTQGKNPNFNPLEFMIDACHNASLEFHAWINPLRIKTDKTPSTLSKDNPYNKWKDNDDYIINYNDNLYLNPAYSDVRKYIIDAIREIVLNYAVDAIHFDDYFYPTTEVQIDKVAYEKYSKNFTESNIPLTQNNWRTTNINSLISGVYSAIKSITNNVAFGISPQANIENDLSMNADVYSWCSITGYCDYICPQVYVNFDHPLLPFDDTVEKWQEITTNKNVKLYIGLAVYKAGSDVDNGTWENSDDILKKEIEYARTKGVDGFMLYSYDYLVNEQTEKEIENAMKII